MLISAPPFRAPLPGAEPDAFGTGAASLIGEGFTLSTSAASRSRSPIRSPVRRQSSGVLIGFDRRFLSRRPPRPREVFAGNASRHPAH